ncbi:MAG: UPF0182 family protein [Gemmatimonadetes bacterium]|nr:UPF0182 family protein [Gemmatimonadota bacterium]
MSRRVLLVLFGVVLLTLLTIPGSAAFLADLWFFQEIGFQVVFTKEITTRFLMLLGVGVVSGAVLYLNLRIAQRGLVPDPIVFRMGRQSPGLDVTHLLRRLSLPAAGGLGLLIGLGAMSGWAVVLRALHRTPFGLTDPVFGRDIGYYVFLLPALSTLLGLLSGLLTVTLLILVPIYFLRGDIILRPRQLRIEPSAGLHLAVLLASLFVLTALRLWFVAIPGLLYNTNGPLVGAGFTDLRATLPALRVSAVVALVAAAVVVVGAVRGKLAWYAFWAVGSYLIVAFVGRGVVPLVVQKLVVAPTELTREGPYLANHIRATRHAWGLDSVETRDLGSEASLTLADLRNNGPTLENVRLWDRAPLLQTFGQLQEIRTYYDFVSVDDDRYWIDGKLRQVLLSPRELNPASLPTRTFINEHLTFTHGMGLTLSPVNQVTSEGLPVLFVKDLPPVSTGSLKISRPQIYYGELANEFVFVGTRQQEFDHPAGDENVSTTYAGTGGVTVGGLGRRILLAAHFGSSKILFSQDIRPESRVLYNRHITDRAKKALPFLTFDRDPYMVVVDDGTLKWILDAYTTSALYPYSFRLPDGTTYMRNSAKVVIDAYDGSVTAYVSAPADPIIQTWAKVFPGIFQPLDSLPAGLRAHIRYPDDLYRTQANLYTTYHMDEPETFYHREDQWQIPQVAVADGSVPFMRHIVMRLPDEAQAEFIYMVPFTPRGKDNLAAWMVARNDGEAYGKLRVYRFPRQSLVYGPRQIENRINQDTEVARQVSLWDQRGSQVIRGDLLVIPIEKALLYVQPLYLQAQGGRIPELKRVVVAYQNQVVMEETLDAALAVMFGGAPATRAEPTAAVAETAVAAGDASTRSLAAEARRRYDAALAAQRAGDWARYGEEIKKLGEVLERLGGPPPAR